MIVVGKNLRQLAWDHIASPDIQLRPAAELLLIRLADKCADEPKSIKGAPPVHLFVGEYTISKWVGRSRAWVSRYMRELRDAGLLERMTKPSPGRSTHHILFPKIYGYQTHVRAGESVGEKRVPDTRPRTTGHTSAHVPDTRPRVEPKEPLEPSRAAKGSLREEAATRDYGSVANVSGSENELVQINDALVDVVRAFPLAEVVR